MKKKISKKEAFLVIWIPANSRVPYYKLFLSTEEVNKFISSEFTDYFCRQTSSCESILTAHSPHFQKEFSIYRVLLPSPKVEEIVTHSYVLKDEKNKKK